jgi:hypothetical protein
MSTERTGEGTLVMDSRVVWDAARKKEIEEAKQEYLRYKRMGLEIMDPDGTLLVRFKATRGEFRVIATSTPTGMRVMKILSDKGDERLTWSMYDRKKVQSAEEKFKDLLSKGYKAYSVTDSGKKKVRVTEFDMDAQEVIMIPPTSKG